MLATTELQAHISSTLTGNGPLSALIGGRILDHVADNSTFPFITIGEVFPTPFRTHSRDGEELLHTIHIWSRAKGFKEAFQIAEAIRPLLDAVTFSLASFTGFGLREGSVWLRDPDGLTRHGALDFRFFLMKV